MYTLAVTTLFILFYQGWFLKTLFKHFQSLILMSLIIYSWAEIPYQCKYFDNRKERQEKLTCTCLWRHDATCASVTDVNTARFTWRENRLWPRSWSVLSAREKATVCGRQPGTRRESWCTLPSRWRAACPTNWPEMSATTASHGETDTVLYSTSVLLLV